VAVAARGYPCTESLEPAVSIDDKTLRSILERLSPADLAAHDLSDSLRTVIARTSTFFDGVAGAGLMMIGPSGLQAGVASDEPGEALEHAQERIGEGPCVDALTYDTMITTSDLEVDERYTDLAPEVVPLGVRAVLGMPIHINGTAAATINIYANTVREWHSDESRALHAFGEVLGSTLTAAIVAHQRHVIVEQLQYALDNRVKIERATGVTMAKHQLDPVSAFNLLRANARSSRRKVAEIADEVLREFDA
jgi:GAF domain-containing protein